MAELRSILQQIDYQRVTWRRMLVVSSFVRKWAISDVRAVMVGARTDLNTTGSDEQYVPVSAGRCILVDSVCLYQAGYNDFEAPKGLRTGFFLLVS